MFLIEVHTSVNLKLTLASTLDENLDNGMIYKLILESWGFREFKFFFEPRDECAILFTQINF